MYFTYMVNYMESDFWYWGNGYGADFAAPRQ